MIIKQIINKLVIDGNLESTEAYQHCIDIELYPFVDYEYDCSTEYSFILSYDNDHIIEITFKDDNFMCFLRDLPYEVEIEKHQEGRH